jgi:predicted DCC family thiol-disulfide oxidoreductase YuxK
MPDSAFGGTRQTGPQPPDKPAPPRIWVIYDGACPLCESLAAWLRKRDTHHRLMVCPLQTPGLLSRFDIPLEEALGALQVVDSHGRRWQGADAVILAVGEIRGFGWLNAVWRVPWLRPVARAVYRWIARHRPRRSAACDSHHCQQP